MADKLVKIRAQSLDDAYREMKLRYGPHAIVKGTHLVSEGGVLGLFSKRSYELTVAVPREPQPPASRPRSSAERRYTEHSRLEPAAAQGKASRESLEELLREAKRRMNGEAPQRSASVAPIPAPAPPAPAQGIPKQEVTVGQTAPVLNFPQPEQQGIPDKTAADLRHELREIREMMQVIYTENPGAGLPPEVAPHYRQLVQSGVTRKIAAGLVASAMKGCDPKLLKDSRIVSQRISMEIRRRMPVTGGIALQGGECHIAAFCGATGVGKTTTIAKLAALYKVREDANVALVTTDTYRIAAPEQLNVYASIIGVPIYVAPEPDQLAQTIEGLRHYDLLLVDTAGGSQFNLEQINELKQLMRAAQPQETFLVLPAGMDMGVLRDVASNFKCVNPTSLIFTKLDECSRYGQIITAAAEFNLPLSYFSTGQNVPEDIELASPARVAKRVMRGRKNRG